MAHECVVPVSSMCAVKLNMPFFLTNLPPVKFAVLMHEVQTTVRCNVHLGQCLYIMKPLTLSWAIAWHAEADDVSACCARAWSTAC